MFKKDLEIADIVEKSTGVKIDRKKLFIMTLLHDSGRFRMIDLSNYENVELNVDKKPVTSS